jgi:hypothetical protein
MAGKIETYMAGQVDNFTDPLTGEVNEAGLAEDACAEFGIELEPDGSAPDRIYNKADRIARLHEIKTGARKAIIPRHIGEYFDHVNSSFDHPKVSLK